MSSFSQCTSVNLPVAIAVSGATAILATYFYQKTREAKRYPPGPIALPLVGNLVQLSVRKRLIPTLFDEWANSYGALYAVEIGKTRAVVLNSKPVVCEALCEKRSAFSDRPNWLPLIKLVYEDRGLMWQNGETWKDLRQCAFAALTGCGIGDQSLEERIQREAEKLIREFTKKEEDECAFSPMELLHKAVTDIICSIVFGCRYKYKSVQFQKFICMIRDLSDCNVLDSTTFFPFLTSLPLPRLTKAVKNMKDLICFIEEEIERHKESFDPCCLRDFIDLHLKEISEGAFLNKKDDICKQQTEVAIIDLFICGTEPTSTALSWAILCMIAFPDIQQKCHDEIDSVICDDRLPDICDAVNMPYVRATLHEVLRRFTILPLGLPHATQQDVGLAGYCIRADTIVICNIQAIHLNDQNWKNPCVFDPERFLEGCDKPCFVERDYFFPFGIGPRSCPGKELSWNMLFILFTALMQRFSFQRGCDCDLLRCFEGRYRFTFAPMPYKVKIRTRC